MKYYDDYICYENRNTFIAIYNFKDKGDSTLPPPSPPAFRRLEESLNLLISLRIPLRSLLKTAHISLHTILLLKNCY